jgi:hypothetical protein
MSFITIVQGVSIAASARATAMPHAQRLLCLARVQRIADETPEAMRVGPEEHGVLLDRRVGRVKEQVVAEAGYAHRAAQQRPCAAHDAGLLHAGQQFRRHGARFERQVPAEDIAQRRSRLAPAPREHALVGQGRDGREAIARGRHLAQHAGCVHHAATSSVCCSSAV